MDTKYWLLSGETEKDEKMLNEATELLKNGHVVAFPTETVYGLGACATDEHAINKIFQAKGRPADNPLIVHVGTKEQLAKLVKNLPAYVEKLIDTFSPGPLTYVLEHNGICAPNVTAGLSTVAVRIPNHPVTLSLLTKSNIPIAAPSANLSGKPSPTEARHVKDDLFGKISGIIDGGSTGVGVESTVLDCTGDIPVILRHGGLTKEELSRVIGLVEEESKLIKEDSTQPKSPGMKYKHYAPEIPLILVDGDIDKIREIIRKEREQSKRIGLLVTEETASQIKANKVVSLGKNEQDIARNLYSGLRAFSKEEVDVIVCESLPKSGVGQAIMDRLERAATYII